MTNRRDEPYSSEVGRDAARAESASVGKESPSLSGEELDRLAFAGACDVSYDDFDRLIAQARLALSGAEALTAAAVPQGQEDGSGSAERARAGSPASVEPSAAWRQDVFTVATWLASLDDLDMDEVCADGGVTVAMVVQQEAREMGRRLRRFLSSGEPTPEETDAAGEGGSDSTASHNPSGDRL